MDGKMALRRSSRLSQNVELGKSVSYALIEKTDDEDEMPGNKVVKRGKKKDVKDVSEGVTSTDGENTTEDSDYTISQNEKQGHSGQEEEDSEDQQDDTSDNSTAGKRNKGKNYRRSRNQPNRRKSIRNSRDSDESSSVGTKRKKGKTGKKGKSRKQSKRASTEQSVVLHEENSNEEGSNSLDDNSNNVNKSNKQNKPKGKSYIERLQEDVDDDDFDIFKKNSKFDKNKRISTINKGNSALDMKSKKRKSIYVESSDSEDSSGSDYEYTTEKTRPTKKLKNNNMSNNPSKNIGNGNNKEQRGLNNMNKNAHKNFDDFNMYEKIKKGPKNLHEIIEEIYYYLFNRENNEMVKISTFFLNFLAECSGNETLTWTVDIIDYIDKQVYLYEEIGNNAIDRPPTASNRPGRAPTSITEIITPSTAQSGSKITNIDEIIKDEMNFEKICTFKCKKLEQYLSSDLDNDVLIKKKNENNKSYKSFTSFFSDFAYHFDESYMHEVLYVCIWIFSLSISKYRKIRFTASLASHSILLGLCKKINYINNHEKQARKQLLAEYTRERENTNKGNGLRRGSTIGRSSRNSAHTSNTENEKWEDADIEELIQYTKKRDNGEIRTIVERNLIISQLIDNINEDRKNLTILNNFLLCTYNIIYKNKIKDVFSDIRAITLEYFLHYVQVLSSYFTNRKYTKLLIWILYDKDSKVKMCALDILIYLCTLYNTNGNFKIVELLYMCKKKLLNFIFDDDYNVRVKTFELILQMSKMKIRKDEFIDFKKKTKNNTMAITNKKDEKTSDVSSQYESDEYEENDMTSDVDMPGNNELSIVLDDKQKKKKSTTNDMISILSKKEKKIVSNLIWFNNNNKISKMITSLIYESQIKNKIKMCDQKRNNYFDVEQNDANCEIVKYNLIFLTKYLNRNIPTVKNFVHYFDYLANYNENMKLYTVIDRFVSGIREMLDAVNCIDVMIELLCKDDIALETHWGGTVETVRDKIDLEKSGSGDSKMTEEGPKRGNQKGKGNNKVMDKSKEKGESEKERGCESSNGEENELEVEAGGVSEKRDLRKCLLYICESAYRNFQNDINEMERNKNRKSLPQVSDMNVGDKNSMHNAKLNRDMGKIKKMIIYTFGIIKHSKLLIKLHQTNQEHLLLVFKILKVAIQECKHIYRNGEKNNIYNFASTIMEYFKNDIDSNINFFFNNVFVHLKDTYEYLYYVIKNLKLPYYSAKCTMNMISLFLSLNDLLKGECGPSSGGGDNQKLSTDIFFDLYYSYFNNFLDAFLYYRKNYNAEIECEEEEEYIRNGRNKVVIVNEMLMNKDRNVVDSIENDLVCNLTNLIHMYTLCFSYINNDLSSYVEKKNDLKKINKSIKKVIEKDYFQFIVNEKCQAYFKENIFVNEFLDGHVLHYGSEHSSQGYHTGDEDGNEDDDEENDGNDDEEDDVEDSEPQSDQRDEEYTTGAANRKRNKKTKGKKGKNNKRNAEKNVYENYMSRRGSVNSQKINNKAAFDKDEHFHQGQNFYNLYYSSDACMHANVVIQLCFYIIKSKINSVYYYEEENSTPKTPSSRLLLLCIDLIYVIYENYIYYLCRKRYFFNYLYSKFFLKNDSPLGEEVGGSKNVKKEMSEKNNQSRTSGANDKELSAEEKESKGENKNDSPSSNINMEDLKNLLTLSEKKRNILKNIFVELNYIYNNLLTLRDDLNDILVYLIKASNNTILKYGTFLNLMNVAQLENVLLYSVDDMRKYKTLEVFINACCKEEGQVDQSDGVANLQQLLSLEGSGKTGDATDYTAERDSSAQKMDELVQVYLDADEQMNKYKSVARYVYKEDNVLFNFVTELFKNVENINNDNYNFVNSFLSIDIGVFFPINTYTYIADMCKIYNKDQLSTDDKILEMQYTHMTLIIAQFILHCNNINIFNSCLGVLLLIHLNVKNRGLSSIALNFHNKLKKYSIDIFYEVLLCALIGLYTAYINNALEEKDLLLFSTSIASRLGVKIVEKQKLPLCKFIHSCVNCALNLKNQNSFLKYIFPYAQKLTLSEYQIGYLKKQILNLIESYNTANNTQIKFESSIFEHLFLIICKKRKLNEEFRDTNYENSYMNLNESIHMNISKNIAKRISGQSNAPSIKTKRSSQGVNLHVNKGMTQNGYNSDGSKSDSDSDTDKDASVEDVAIGAEEIRQNNVNEERDENKHATKIKEEVLHGGEKYGEEVAKDRHKDRASAPNLESTEPRGDKGDDSDYEKTPSNSTLSNFISQNEDEDNVFLIGEAKRVSANNGNKGANHNDEQYMYEINSSPKPIRTKNMTKFNLIRKDDLDSKGNNDREDKSPNGTPKHSDDRSLNSSLNNASDKDNDDVSIISEKKEKLNYLQENDDDSCSDMIPGLSPMKARKKNKSELSTPISYADDLMNF
ncbi:conserved Plasmodium protein, unknown function [Plasmodium knowlesi strain H]|uniref:SCD domain-containing protein n=3 Tax=Plasmodium knowlesi TaxID=5850 RepID=A0A5K1UQG9_PLAKH|nr:STAG domain-containing protein, putative [Plasmodium knowlesi strain H]OTN65524.1 Uncharacterized protein PKNOH_S110096200 [Plasmodium knowlesi]CAA9989581.1 STAG domain-containing protein, putative [Plasmodium knowlesi strain H]SBO22632.1 conserved Plasmodium protein, unknown function [Plasmodium knowlesi strain H]SBO23429.1 conserved Plasmodium protein, unknown function [Plasmodium knowlesi strain H]VVS79055.1 STAG domain-containing protein, putative [Plasmodium knowlesi strain H]|eukprot:XP_002260306.1 hypothetical protein, conserved in Plasmodium species [Plasmodium knowlesi strain H]